MRAWLDFGTAATGLVIGDLTKYAYLLSDGGAADFTGATLDEIDGTNLPGLYILDAPLITASARGKVWVTATPAVWSTLRWDETILANAAHGGAAATFETAAGVLAQESAAGTIEGSFAQNIGRWNALAQPAMEVYLPVKGWDWTSDPIISVTYDGALSVGNGIWLDLRWWRSTDATLQSVELGNLANDGTTWTPNASLAAALAAIAPTLMCNDVSCTIGAWTQDGQQIEAGTLTINFNAAVGGATGSVALEILDVTQDACHIYWDRYGRCLCNPALREDAAGGGGGGTY